MMKRSNAFSAGYQLSHLKHFNETIAQLQSDSFRSPIIFDGSAWQDETVREDMVVCLLKSLSGNTSAENLVLQNSLFGLKAQNALTELFHQKRNLKSITIKNLIEGDHFRSFRLPATTFKSRSVEMIILERCTLVEETCLEFATLLQSPECAVESISLTNVDVCGTESCAILSDAISRCKSLRSVSLCNLKQMEPKETNNLLLALAHNKYISELKLENMNLGDRHSVSIAEIINQSASLRILSMQKNNLAAEALSNMSSSFTLGPSSLRSLDISNNPIGDDGVKSVMSWLKGGKFSNLERLRLANCEIWHDGCVEVAKSLLFFPPTVTEVDMDRNEMESCGLELLSSLQANKSIERILRVLPTCSDDPEETKAWREIDLYLRLNKANRKQIKNMKSLPSGCVANLLARPCVTQDKDVLFHFLTTLPNC